MHRLQNRRILLGITGGIAAYKAAELTRTLQREGAQVQVVMTRSAADFITPLTLQALSGRPVRTELLDTQAEAAMGHIELARWADLVLVAPASADFMARLAAGRADELLLALCLATAAPVALAPAMNQNMWLDAATRENCSLLKNRGIHLFGPGEGEQACKEVGPGRMLEPQELADCVAGCFETRLLEGKRVLVTAGSTREALDPVRYIGNRSSGKMGFALAAAAADAGAEVTLISGASTLPTPERVQRVEAIAAEDMRREVLERVNRCELLLAVAAVSDYRPAERAPEKIEKTGTSLHLELVENPDILAEATAQNPQLFAVGFAAETGPPAERGRQKLKSKKLDMVVANDVSRPDIGFDAEDNEVLLLWPGGEAALPRASKRQLAVQILEQVARRMAER